jgi:hypothetical protein
MFGKLLTFLGLGNASLYKKVDTRRQHIRHPGVHAEILVDGRVYGIRDWSMGGLSFEAAPNARLMAGDKVQVVMKFRFLHDTITIQHQVEIIRSAKRGFAAKFEALPATARRQLERVLDSQNAQKFLESQVA